MMQNITIKGLNELLKKLENCGSEKKHKPILRKAARAGIAPVVKAEKAECPVDEGALKRSMDRKVTGHGYKISAIAGADINYVEGDERPGRYDHLVIHGHATEDGGVVPPNDFISRAAEQSLGKAQDKYVEKLKSEIEKLATDK